MSIRIEAYSPDADLTAEKYAKVELAIEDHKDAYDEIMGLLEKAHTHHFGSLKGRYVRTGATKASLTTRGAAGAIREAHGQSAEFGTDVWYAHFLTRAPKDPYNGQIRKTPPGKGLSAVAVFPDELRGHIADIVLNKIVKEFE